MLSAQWRTTQSSLTAFWHSGKGCCVPQSPSDNRPPPQCNPGWSWNGGDLKYYPTPTTDNGPAPTPSAVPGHNHRYHKRQLKKRQVAFCPVGLDACPLNGQTDFECVDTSADIQSCGGCVSTGQGQDCTAISGAFVVGCERGSCRGIHIKLIVIDLFLIFWLFLVYSCSPGYKLSQDGASCTASS